MRSISQLELERLQVQSRLDEEKTAQERNALGQFATPPELAIEIARYALRLWEEKPGPVRFLDPGFGTGAFYTALRQTFPARRIRHAAGVEVDARFAKAAQSLWRPFKVKVTESDFTTLQAPPRGRRFNLVLTNPPYVRHHHLGSEAKQRLQATVARRLGVRVSGLAGLYCYFLLLSHDWLDDAGLAAWLIPSEFMDVNYGSAIKEYLSREVTLLRIHRFHEADIQFDDALVTSAVVVFRKTSPSTDHCAEFSYGGTLLSPTTSERVPIRVLRAAGQKWSNYPMAAGNGKTTRVSAVTLGELFSIKRGIATGANGFFILPREEAVERGVPREFLRPILPSPRHLKSTIIGADHEGYPSVERPLALIDCPRPETIVRARYPRLWAYLEAGKREGIHERYLTAGRSPWYAQESRPPAPYLCTYMGRNRTAPFRFIWNKSQATAANVYLLLYPKEPLARALRSDPQLYAKVFELLQKITAENFLGEGRVYGGGLFKMEPKELARLDADALVRQTGLHELRQQQQQLALG